MTRGVLGAFGLAQTPPLGTVSASFRFSPPEAALALRVRNPVPADIIRPLQLFPTPSTRVVSRKRVIRVPGQDVGPRNYHLTAVQLNRITPRE